MRKTKLDAHARTTLPTNVRGTAPGKVKWSYWPLDSRSSEWMEPISTRHLQPVYSQDEERVRTLCRLEEPTPYMSTSCVACRLKLSSTLVYGASET